MLWLPFDQTKSSRTCERLSVVPWGSPVRCPVMRSGLVNCGPGAENGFSRLLKWKYWKPTVFTLLGEMTHVSSNPLEVVLVMSLRPFEYARIPPTFSAALKSSRLNLYDSRCL